MSRLIRRRAAAEVLERRYRRLLACYPASYRAANAEEMLGVALARSSAGRRRPELGEAVSLIVSGFGKRVSAARTGYRDRAWREAGAVLTIVGSIVLATFSTRDVVTGMSRIWVPEFAWRLSWSEPASAVGWAMVAGLAIRGQWRGRGWRTVAATGACLCVAVQAVMLTQIYAVSSAWLVGSWWKLVIAVVTVLSALVAVGSEGRPIGWRPITAMVTAGAAIAVYPAVLAATITVSELPGGGSTISTPLSGVEGYLNYGKAAVGGIIVLAAVARCRPEVRRRVAILLLPVVVTIPLVPRISGSSPQWAALALVPLLGFVAGLVWLHRYERFLSSLSAK